MDMYTVISNSIFFNCSNTSIIATQYRAKEHSLIGKTGSFKLLIFSSSLNTLVHVYAIKGSLT